MKMNDCRLVPGKVVYWGDIVGNIEDQTDLQEIVEGYVTEDELEGKQDKLVSGENIKTINNISLLGSGNIDIQGGGGGGQENVIEVVKVNGTALTVTDKGVDVTVPTQLSDVATEAQQAAANSGINATKRVAYDALVEATTLAGYGITDAYTKSEIDGKISSAVHYKGSVDTYAELPASPEVGDMYNVAQANPAANVKAGDNVAWNGTSWDVLAGVVDLSAYTTTAEFKAMTDAQVDALLAD